MSYEKLGFVSGQTLKAEHLNHMEDGIANSGGVTSWNDLSDRPFYEEVKMGNVVENYTVEVTEGYAEIPEVYGKIGVGMTYEVFFDGQVYECVAWYHDGWEAIILGNGLFVEAEGNGEDFPFALDFYSDPSAYLNADNGQHEVGVRGEYMISKKTR